MSSFIKSFGLPVLTFHEVKIAEMSSMYFLNESSPAKNTSDMPSNVDYLCLLCDESDPPDVNSNSDVGWVACDGCFKWCHTFCCGTEQSHIA